MPAPRLGIPKHPWANLRTPGTVASIRTCFPTPCAAWSHVLQNPKVKRLVAENETCQTDRSATLGWWWEVREVVLVPLGLLERSRYW